MPVYIGDYLADTMHLSTQQHGAYLLLLFHLWRRGSLPDDDGVLAKITGLERADWLVNRPAMASFFQIADGLWRHRRVERERARIDKIARANSEKAQHASQKRWKKQQVGSACPDASSGASQLASDDVSNDALRNASGIASGNASRIASGNAPAMREQTESQSQPQAQSEPRADSQATSEYFPHLARKERAPDMGHPTSLREREGPRVSEETREGDARLLSFRTLLASYWREKNPAFPEMPWHKKDFMALRAFLAACPGVTEAQFRQMLSNRARSPVAHGDRVYLWIGNLTRFQEEMTVYHRPVSAVGGSYGSSRAEINRDAVLTSVDRAIAVVREGFGGAGKAGAESATVTDTGMFVADGAGSCGRSLGLPGESDYRVETRDVADGAAGADGSLPYGAAVACAGGVDAHGGSGVSVVLADG